VSTSALYGPSFDQILGNEARELRAFLSILDREQQALIEGNTDQLLPINAHKNQIALRLRSLGLRRVEWLITQGFGMGRAGVAAWLATLAQNAPCVASGKRLWNSPAAPTASTRKRPSRTLRPRRPDMGRSW
jgi:flagellar FlgN protein